MEKKQTFEDFFRYKNPYYEFLLSRMRCAFDVKEVKFGFECGVGIENWQDLQVGDQLEAFEYVEVARKLGKTIAEEQAEAKAESEAGGTQE